MTLLVTGHLGYIGAQMVHRLLAFGYDELHPDMRRTAAAA